MGISLESSESFLREMEANIHADLKLHSMLAQLGEAQGDEGDEDAAGEEEVIEEGEGDAEEMERAVSSSFQALLAFQALSTPHPMLDHQAVVDESEVLIEGQEVGEGEEEEEEEGGVYDELDEGEVAEASYEEEEGENVEVYATTTSALPIHPSLNGQSQFYPIDPLLAPSSSHHNYIPTLPRPRASHLTSSYALDNQVDDMHHSDSLIERMVEAELARGLGGSSVGYHLPLSYPPPMSVEQQRLIPKFDTTTPEGDYVVDAPYVNSNLLYTAPASGSGSPPVPRGRSVSSSTSMKPGQSKSGTPVAELSEYDSRKRTEIPAIEDDESIKPYGCNYPFCLNLNSLRAGMGELDEENVGSGSASGSGSSRKGKGKAKGQVNEHAQEHENGDIDIYGRAAKKARKASYSSNGVDHQAPTAFRTIKELRDHCTVHRKAKDPTPELMFRCALDPCGKSFKSAAGLRWHFQHAANGHFLISIEEGEDVPTKKFKPVAQSSGRETRCPVAGCSKSFKQGAGLAYHLTHSTNHRITEAMLSIFPPTIETKVRWWMQKQSIDVVQGNADGTEMIETTISNSISSALMLAGGFQYNQDMDLEVDDEYDGFVEAR